MYFNSYHFASYHFASYHFEEGGPDSTPSSALNMMFFASKRD